MEGRRHDENESEDSYTEEEDEEEEIVTEGVKIVEWPPHKEIEDMEDSMTTVTTSVRYVTNHTATDQQQQQQQQQHQQQTFLSKELFSPGKLDVGSRWKPPTNDTNSQLSGAPKRKFKSLDEVLQNENGPGKHVTYHVPPGTTRTRKAQESYEKHLNVIVREVK